jgi:hypothetical protein
MESKEIDELVESCRAEFQRTLEEGCKPPPTGFAIFDLPEEFDDVSVAVVTMSRQLHEASDVEDLARHVKNCTNSTVVAAGLIILMPEPIWTEVFGPAKMPLDVVGILHVEYLASSFKTWVLTRSGSGPGTWSLHATGPRTKLPRLLSDSCYGTSVGQA